MSRRRSRSPSPGRYSRSCSSNDPRDLERRIFVGNLPTSDMEKKDLEDLFSPYGKIVDVNMAVERRQAKPQSQQSPPRRSEYDRYYRGGSAAEDYYRRKDEPYRDPYADPWNGRREPEDERVRPEERRRNELYRQYYEELQRRHDVDRPVDCSVIVVNKAQNREYAETVGRKVRDLGMVVDLIFLNTEVSLTQALEDVGRARTPFAIIITQQHQVHRSCTVNILFGTPQEHRNMPMQDAMMLVAHNYDTYKVENREKEREEIARKAAKMADDVLLREPDRESHPISLLTNITLLAENRFVTPEELDSLIAYLKDKRTRLVRSAADPLAAPVHVGPPAAVHHDVPPSAAGHPPSTLTPPQSGHLSLSAGSSTSANPSHQQELQAKILSLFNSGSGQLTGTSGLSSAPSQSHSYGSLGQPPSQNPARPPMPGPAPGSQGYSNPPGRMPVAPGGQRPPASASGINFDNPSVQKALDTLIQSGPSLNHLVGSGASQQPPPRPSPNMGQAPPVSLYPRHY
ncbi:nuclear receptor coactivator 5 isoform X7 [Archocentrus centrarchus]|uniref:nuclear receptor coactivator 5 isoform X7 n=1 Tax=Archocentrus centrarchus TaxID=63155 RepID=UPI0011EA3FA3|nr:nuclear receptor coactivator 5 isoform X7 [Archocentrus centrarchus]